ncbi:archaeosortase/exosortase family protein [Planctomycetota bacterium]
MLKQDKATLGEIVGSVTQLVLLIGLCSWMFWSEASHMRSGVLTSSKRVYVLIVPLAISLLLFHRRVELAQSLTKGSIWGCLFILIGLFLYAVTTWPFSFGYIRELAMIPVLIGVVLVTCGWRVLKLSLPMILLVMLSIPIGSRIYARLIIAPETYTLAFAANFLDQLPGVDVVTKGVDLLFRTEDNSGVIALGESNRGARLLFAFSMLGIFVVFSRIRSFGRLVVVAMATIPIILFCNFLRFLCWAVLAVYLGFEPVSVLPRNISAVFSLFLAYGLFYFICTAKINLFVEDDSDKESLDTGESSNA